MVVLVLFALAVPALVALVVLGWVPDTRQPGRRWYPAAPDPPLDALLDVRPGPRAPGEVEPSAATGDGCCPDAEADWGAQKATV